MEICSTREAIYENIISGRAGDVLNSYGETN
jgi:hypothetical protein